MLCSPDMEIMFPSSTSLSASQEGSSTSVEFSLQQSLLFSDSLKDLNDLRSQLYSAAEYFESYSNDDQQQFVVDALKDYAVKALVNTVDHLGSISYKVNGLLDEKVDEVSEADFRVSCIEQQLRTCHQCIDLAGLSQQSLIITTPKYHKRYIIPVGEPMPESGKHAVTYNPEFHLQKKDNESRFFQDAIHSTMKARTPSSRKGRSGRSLSPSLRARSSSPSRRTRSPSPSPQPGKYQFPERRPGSPVPTSNSSQLSRSGSFSIRPSLCNSPSTIQRFPMEIRKSSSMHMQAPSYQKELEKNPSKAKSFFKSLFSKRKTNNDDMLYTYLDEY